MTGHDHLCLSIALDVLRNDRVRAAEFGRLVHAARPFMAAWAAVQ